ncbi:MAG: hypothetical protein WCE87_09795 [Candidatus Udaeobacter sp.]
MARSYRACWSSYIVLTICVGLIFAITLPMALRGDRDAAALAATGIIALLFIHFWLPRFRLTINPDGLVYSSLFIGERRISLADITRTNIIYQTGLYGFRYLLAITANSVTTRINFKVFSREAASALFHLVRPNESLEPTAGRRDEHI